MPHVVMVNKELIQKDLERIGVSQQKLGAALGFSKSWLGNILAEGKTSEDNLRAIEKALFKEPGSYELKDAPVEKPEATQKVDLTALKMIRDGLDAVVAELNQLNQTQSIIRAQNEELLSAIHGWRKTNTDQHANIIERSKDCITQQLKTRSLIERSVKNEAI